MLMIFFRRIDLKNESSGATTGAMELFGLSVLGVSAGALTTWVGLGGGMFMTLVLVFIFGPEIALATAAPALWVGNTHRVVLFRSSIVWPAVVQVGGAALVGALVGGLLATKLPASVLQFLIVGATVGALVYRPTGRPGVTSRAWSGALGGTAGFVSATSGGGAPLLTPAVLGLGIEGARFVATASLISVLVHTGRIIAYAAGGWVDLKILGMAAVLAGAIMVGNVLGRWCRDRTSERVLNWALRGMTTVLAAMAVLSLA